MSIVKPSTNQLQSANIGTPGRVIVFTYGNTRLIDFDLPNGKSMRFTLDENGISIYVLENGTITKAKNVATF